MASHYARCVEVVAPLTFVDSDVLLLLLCCANIFMASWWDSSPQPICRMDYGLGNYSFFCEVAALNGGASLFLVTVIQS